MYPIALDLKRIPVLLSGQGELLARRLKQLDEAGAAKVSVIENPGEADIAKASVVLVAGFSREVSEKIAARARAAGKLINVEDMNDLCDFYFTANVRRGDLIIAVSTSGASPTLARKVRDWIATRFGEEWADYTREIADLRKSWKAEGKDIPTVLKASEEHIAKKRWLA